MPALRRASTRSVEGTPKWKLTTLGLVSMSIASIASSWTKLV